MIKEEWLNAEIDRWLRIQEWDQLRENMEWGCGYDPAYKVLEDYHESETKVYETYVAAFINRYKEA